MTNQTDQSQYQPVLVEELIVPSLDITQRQLLLLALNTVLAGLGKITVALAYNKQTESKPRLAGKDYVAMPGVDPTAQFGEIVRVFRRKKDNALRFTIASASRGDGATPIGYTAVIPEGIKSFTITGFVPAQQATSEEVA